MKTLILTSTAIAFAFTLNLTANASVTPAGVYSADQMTVTSVDRRRPRVPGGSGCNSIRDILEHPECRR